MNNKKLGIEWEKGMCDKLRAEGYWVHFITPDARGAQPFDIIAVKDGFAHAIECKTLLASEKYFRISRIEENQRLAFEKWLACGNCMPIIAVKHGDDIKCIEWNVLRDNGKVEL